MGEEGVPIQDDCDNDNADSTVHEIKKGDDSKEDDTPTDDAEVTIETVHNKDEPRQEDEP